MSPGTSRPITRSGVRIGPSRALDVDLDVDLVVNVNLDGDDDVDGDVPR